MIIIYYVFITNYYNYILLQDDDLYEAVQNQNIIEVEILIKKGANPNKKHDWVSYHFI